MYVLYILYVRSLYTLRILYTTLYNLLTIPRYMVLPGLC